MENELLIKYDLINKDYLLNDFKLYLQASEKTTKIYISRVKQFIKYLQANEISKPTIIDILNYRQFLIDANAKPTTIQLTLIAIKHFFKWCEFAKIYKNICADADIKSIKIDKKHHKRDALTSEQVKLLFDVIDTTTEKGKRDYAIIRLAITTALRVSEIANIEMDDIQNKGDKTIIYIKGKGHTTKDDFINIPSKTYQSILDYIAIKDDAYNNCKYLFTSTSNNNKNKNMTSDAISRMVKSYLKKIGLGSNKYVMHSLRHTSATQSLLNGNSIQETKEFMRHNNINTTLIYSHNIDKLNNNNKVASSIDDII